MSSDSTTPQPGSPAVSTESSLWAPPPEITSRHQDVVTVLRSVALFDGLSTRELKKVQRLLHERSFATGEVVFREGDKGAGLYIILRGAVSIVDMLPDGGEKVLVTLGERQFFGEMALLDSGPRSASAVARAPTVLLGFFQPDLENLVERDARLGAQLLWNMGKILSARLRAMSGSPVTAISAPRVAAHEEKEPA